MRAIGTFSFVVIALGAAPAMAQQQGLKLPAPSPPAEIAQTVGMSEIHVSYHRPAVNGRKVWGELVPYGEVWRAGANENTTVSFSSPVKVGGKTLPAGTYGLHMIPTAKDWTVIFNKVSDAWGSFAYDAKEDALRFTVTPQSSDAFEERLSYRFDDPTEKTTTLTMHWEKLKLPIKLEFDTPAVVMQNIRGQLHGLPQFNAAAWAQAATYWATHGGNLDEAQKLAEKGLTMQQNFQTLTARATVADKKGDHKLAGELRQKALAGATENELNLYGYGLLNQRKVDEAIAIFQKNVSAHPDSWNVHDSLGEALALKGDKKAAVDSYAKALTLVKDEPNKKRIEQTLTRLKK